VLSTTSILVLSVIEEKSVAQQARDYDERKFRALIENSTDVFTLIDQEATIFYASPSLTKVIGFTVEDFVGTNVFAYIFEGDRERLRKLFGEILTSPGKTLTAEYRTLTKSGEVKWMEGIGTNLLEEPGVRGIALCYRDIDERKKLDLVKTQFVALASHQLRTPLTTMRWYTEALRNLVKGKAKLAEYTEAIYVSILKMSSLATLMLDVSRIELGTFEDRAEEIDLVKIVSSIASDFAPEISSKHLILNTHYPKIIPTIWTSPKLIHTVVQNILGNSIHYTNEHGQIDLSIKIQNQELQLAINDNGIGIPSSAQDKIFTKLFRAENSKRMMPDGTGLGLYLVKSIVERVGGKIWFISEENKGTTFYVNIPIKLAKRRTNVKA
jgi:PAS domain S-box-containing protein